MLIYVIRHGQSETNSASRWTGWFDTPLTDKGRKQAQKIAEFLKNITFDKVFSSDLLRAKETAKIALPDYLCEESSLLREINVGCLANTPISDMTAEQRTEVFNNGYASFGGETRADFIGRINKFMAKLQELECENVAIFSHAGWLCGMLNAVLGVHIPRKHICCNNCTVAVFEYLNQNWRLYSWINL